MNHKDYFNMMADKWDSICNHNNNKINEILNLVNIRTGSKILDVGTGTGILIPYLADRIGNTGRITAVDLSDKMIAIAKSKYPNICADFVAGDIFSLALPFGCYDVIMFYSVFPHLVDKYAAVRILSKLLKPGGKFVICHSQSRHDINLLHKNGSIAIVNDILPEASIIKYYFSVSGLNTIAEVDNERMFVLIGKA